MVARRPLTALLLCVALLVAGAPSRASADPWWGQDKALHLLVGLSLGSSCYAGLWALNAKRDSPALRAALCASLGQIPGLGKELYDSGQPGNIFSAKDLLFTALGVLLGTAAGWLLEHLGGGNKEVAPRVRAAPLLWRF